MIDTIKHHLRVLISKVRESRKRSGGEGRSPKWRDVEKKHLAAHPSCAACAGTRTLQVHHKQPFHLHPELELEDTNLLTLCMGPNECHLRLGHPGGWHTWNPNVELDARAALNQPARRPEIEARAKTQALPMEEPPEGTTTH